MRIGVFDSGIGGEAVARALRVEFPEAELLVVNDREHLPYGDKTHKEIKELTDAAITPLLLAECDLIIIACNSATTAAIDWLRNKYPTQFFIGVEPMLKTAAKLTKTGIVTVCATPATLSSERYKQRKQRFTASITVLEPDCHDWAYMIEHDNVNDERIAQEIVPSIQAGTDVIVLGCTHYHWIKEDIIRLAGPNITVLEPSRALAAKLKTLLAQSELTAVTNASPRSE